jgi:hypothetical protein
MIIHVQDQVLSLYNIASTMTANPISPMSATASNDIFDEEFDGQESTKD